MTDYRYDATDWGLGYADGFNGDSFDYSVAINKDQYRQGYEQGKADRVGSS